MGMLSTEQRDLNPHRLMSDLDCILFFKALNAVYPYKCKGYTGDTLAVWINALKRHKYEHVREALSKYVDEGDEWPPGLPGFLKRVKQLESVQRSQERMYKPLSQLKTDEEHAYSKAKAKQHVYDMRYTLTKH